MSRRFVMGFDFGGGGVRCLLLELAGGERIVAARPWLEGAHTGADRLEARGRVVLVVGGPDSDMCFNGWFRSNDSGEAPNKAGEFLGIKVGGPTRAGHYFLPAFSVNEHVRGLPDKGPVLLPGKTYEWSVVYDPAANDGQGSITATLGDESVTLRLRQGQRRKAEAARFDRFGLFSIGPGVQIVKLYLDDLEYTAASRL